MIIRWFWREWRSPALLIVWAALSLAVACVFALSSIGERMEKGLSAQSRDFLAGDRALRSDKAPPDAWLARAQQTGLTVTRQLRFTTMTFAGETPQLADVKAVENAWPLYGELQTRPAGLKPVPGQVLLAPRLMALLNLKIGDSLDVGDSTLKVAGEVLQEPDAGFNPFQLAPRLIMNMADVPATGAVQPGSRLGWVWQFAGTAAQLADYEHWLLPQLGATQRWLSPEQDDSALGKSLERSRQFLLLCALLTLLLAIAAIVVAMNHYCRSRYDLVAILKTLGAGRAALRRLVMGQWACLMILSTATGLGGGKICEWLLLALLRPVLPAVLPGAGWMPALWAISTMVAVSLMVGCRPYRILLATRPVRVLRRESVAAVWPLRYYLPAMVLIIGLMLAALAGNNTMLWSVLAGVCLLAVLCALVGWMMLQLLHRLSLRSLAARLAISRLLRQPLSTLSQLAAFSLSFMLLALLLVLRGDLLDRWQQQMPADSPNYFLINIAPEQLTAMKSFLTEHQVAPSAFWPIVRARLTAINQQPPADVNKDEALNRELNLTWQTQTSPSGPVTAGQWPPKPGEVSVDEGLAKRLNLHLGDRLTFTGDTTDFSATISSLRQIDWASLQPNFFFIFPEGGLDGQPVSWLTSFRLTHQEAVLTQLTRIFPTVGVLDIRAILRQVSAVLAQVSRALEVMVALVTLCGVLLLLAQVQVGMQQRRQELVVWRTLGAGKRLLRHSLWWEFLALGAVSGLVAALGAELALGLLQTRVFDFPWRPDWRLWVVLPLAGAFVLALCGGWLGSRLLRGKALFRQWVS